MGVRGTHPRGRLTTVGETLVYSAVKRMRIMRVSRRAFTIFRAYRRSEQKKTTGEGEEREEKRGAEAPTKRVRVEEAHSEKRYPASQTKACNST